MARITVEDCIDKFQSRFELVLVASQRARTLHSGEEPTVEVNNDKNTVIALREIADSTITVDQMKENLIQEYQTITINDEEDENLEIETSNNEENSENNNNDEDEVTKREIDGEMQELIKSEDSELEKQYEISEESQIGNFDKDQDLQSETQETVQTDLTESEENI